MLGKFFAPLAVKVLSGLAALLALALIFVMLRADALSAERDNARDKLKAAEAQIALLNVDAALKETASRERAADTAAVAQSEKELVDAIKTTPDSVPDVVRVRLGCERLRRAYHLDADLPAVCRSPG